MGEDWSALKMLTNKPIWKRLLGSCVCIWEENVKIGLKEIGLMWETGLIKFSIGISGEQLWMQNWITGFCTMESDS